MARLPRDYRRDGDAPRVPLRYVGSLAIVCALLLFVDLTGWRYGYLPYEKATGGWALTALGAALVALLLAWLLRPLLSRRRDIYGPSDD